MITLEQVLDAYDYANGCGYLRGTTNWCAAVAWNLNELPNNGIKSHDGQKLVVQHLLDTDDGMSDHSRKVLKLLIGE